MISKQPSEILTKLGSYIFLLLYENIQSFIALNRIVSDVGRIKFSTIFQRLALYEIVTFKESLLSLYIIQGFANFIFSQSRFSNSNKSDLFYVMF